MFRLDVIEFLLSVPTVPLYKEVFYFPFHQRFSYDVVI